MVRGLRLMLSASTVLISCCGAGHWCSTMGCNLHPAVKFHVPRALTTLALDTMVPPEGVVLMQSGMAVMRWVLPADLSCEQREILLLVFLREREEGGLVWRGVCSWGQFLSGRALAGLWALCWPCCPSGNTTQWMVTAHRAVTLGLSSSTNTVEASRACCPPS